MSEKKKTTSTKKTPAKKSSTKAAPKKTTAKSSTAKKTTAAKKAPAKKSTTTKSTTTKKTTTTTTAKKTTTTKPKTTTTKKPTVKKADKSTSIKARIMSYRRSKRLQTTNQAIALILDDFNHKALVGRKFTIDFAESDATAKGVVVAIHGKDSSKQVRIRFDNAGMAGQAINQIAEIKF